MRETRTYGSAGGETGSTGLPYPDRELHVQGVLHRTGKLLCGAPSRKRVTRACRRISVITDRRRNGLAPAEVVNEINRTFRG